MDHKEPSDLLRRSTTALALPVAVTVIIPALLIPAAPINPGWGLPSPASLLPIVIAVALIGSGLTLIALTVSMFRRVGQGTLAPWDPTQQLVVEGVYRYVRNPMISGVFCMVLGEAMLFGSLSLLGFAGVVIVVNVIYMPLSEEPGLRKRFGAPYDEYARNVPRWIPRRTPWAPAEPGANYQ